MATTQTYLLNGPTTFVFPFNVRTPDVLTLSIVPGEIVPPASYEVIGTGPNSTQVTVDFPGAPTDGLSSLVVSRVIPATKVSSFTSDQAVTGAALNNEFSNIYEALADTDLGLGFGPPVLWAPTTIYIAKQSVVIFDNKLYFALVSHASSNSFAADLANLKWQFITDLTSLIQGQLLQELTISVPGGLASMTRIYGFVSVHTIDVGNTFPLWRGSAMTTATSAVTLAMRKNNVQFGTISFAPAATAPLFLSTGIPPPRHQFNPGDVFSIEGPSVADLTLSGIALTLPFNLVLIP